MKTSILCTSPFGAEIIRREKYADFVPTIFSDLVFTPIPSEGEGFDFYDNQIALFKTHNLKGYGYYGSKPYLNFFRSIFKRLEACERIELWIEPGLNSHIYSFHLLTLMSQIPDIEKKLFINQTSEFVALMNGKMLKEARPNLEPVTLDYFAEAAIYWEAFRSHTPIKWVDLLYKPSSCFPLFGQLQKRFILQLPLAPTGLRLIDRQILNHISMGIQKTSLVLGHTLANQIDDIHLLSEMAIATSIYALICAPKPAIDGVVFETFDYYSQSKTNKLRLKRFMNSQLKLTLFGERLLKGEGNWLEENKINYWWGGTHITNDNYWSFDPKAVTLISP